MVVRSNRVYGPQSLINLSNSDGRTWFLVNENWRDDVWDFAPTNILEESKPVRIVWSFILPSGGCFTDIKYEFLLEACRQLLSIIRAHSLSSGVPQRASTVLVYYYFLKKLVCWMDTYGFARFADLDEQSILQFQRYISDGLGRSRKKLSPNTVQKYLYIFSYLFRYREELIDGLTFDPFRGESVGRVAGVRDSETKSWPYTPELIAVPLIQGSICLIEEASPLILKARSIYADAVAKAKQLGYSGNACTNAANRALKKENISLSIYGKHIISVTDLTESVNMLYAACFVVLSYLVGARVSEILHLKAGCVQQRNETGSTITYIVGSIFKRQPEYRGRQHEWVAPPVAVQAISVLETLSLHFRHKCQRDELWLRQLNCGGATEWEVPNSGDIQLPGVHRIVDLLRRLALWLQLPKYQGKDWKLSTHQGRKTFVRFAGLRDRSLLFAVAQQIGHRERAVTDYGYCGSDYRLEKEINAEILEQSVGAWENMLAVDRLGGVAGEEILTKRPRFRGSRLKQDIKSYARMLVDAGLVLGVCDWGYCVYREGSSACLGNASGPNPARREPSTCARCSNFVVSDKHQPYWEEQIRQGLLMLENPSLPLQTIRIVRERVQEAKRVIRGLSSPAEKEDL